MKFHKKLMKNFHVLVNLSRELCHLSYKRDFKGISTFFSSLIRRFSPSINRKKNVQSFFDRQYNVDTSGLIRIKDLDIESPHYIHGVYYQASDPGLFKKIISGLPIQYEEFTFIDLGSGKGITLLLASEFPFRKILGIEFASDLNRIAQNNISKYKSTDQKCKHIESICHDAASYNFPEDPLLIYFYNPFDAYIMNKVLDNLEISFKKHPRKIITVFIGTASTRALSPIEDLRDKIFEERPFLVKIQSGKKYIVCKSKGF